ncbi:MAG TPA: PAS domain-containing protein [Cyanobacteria bacterium UBA8553]|nr:PAS domain-containing protein [Cyanobacteria bacterium UBA8553]HAJ61300.1 PAS domain-containing protein [Cyanobacteria bacterium UBA8543]
MLGLFNNFILTSREFIPHGHCYLWKPELVWLHIFSDSLIALAYYSIPITLVYFVRKRVDLPFNWIILLFGSFIVACGTTHLMEIWTIWHPTYWLSGLLKAITAVVSLYTAHALVLLVPKALALPSTAQLEKTNNKLEREIIERKLVEETLRDSEERFRSAFDDAAIGMALVALDGHWLRVNHSLCEIVGYCEQEFLATTFHSITHPDDWECDLNYVRQLLSGEIRTYQMEKRYFHKQGHVVPILLSASLVRDTQGQPLYFIAQIQDITERQQAEEALQQQFLREQLVRAITQRIRQSLNLEEILDATVTQVRQVLQAERVLVYRFQPGEMRSVVTEAVVPGLSALLGQSFSEEVLPQESQRLYKGREIRTISNVEKADLSPATVEFLQKLGVKAKVLVPILQGEHLWGLLVAHQCSEPRQWQQFEINLLEQLATQVAIAIQQSQLYQQAQSHAQQLEQTLQKLQKAQAQLVHSEKMSSLGQLVAGIAHEINNPTSFIYGNIQPAMQYAQDLINLVQLYQQHYPKPVTEITQQLELAEPDFIAEDFPKLLVSMQEGAERINQIVRSLRNFSRLDEMGFKRVDLHEGLDNTLFILQHRLKPQCHRPEIQIIKNYGQLPKVECCPGQLNQVFMNILSNAIDAIEESVLSRHWSVVGEPITENEHLTTHKKPVIRVHTEIFEPDWVIIRIADNGTGIKAEVQPKIFDPFFTTKPVGSGTGLGLSISYQIVVDKHSGKLRCHSAVGQGTEFVIKLPIVQSTSPLALASRKVSTI